MRHLIDFDQLSLEEWDKLYNLTRAIMRDPGAYADSCKGKLVGTLFYEPSTRTQLSFQAAALRLGAQVIGFSDAASSSAAKGESLRDTIKIVANYVDAIVIRNPMEGAALAASLYSPVPLINAGDGAHLHPTQTLADLATIQTEKGSLNNHVVGLCGDLKNGRTVHSLLKALSRFGGNTFVLISTDTLKIPDYVRRALEASGARYTEVNSLEAVIGDLDILYMTRIQKERFPSEEAYKREAGIFILDPPKLQLAKQSLMVLHPLPKLDEITDEVDIDPRCRYFAQAEYGMYIRMALLHTLLPLKREVPKTELFDRETVCDNPRCVTAFERYLPPLTQDGTCLYCQKDLPH
ncbi:MAG: aspartate carbamoyltransferase [Clostridiales bacterium]|nr:aspartate carbamoyltransferase [Clostridiales bacterium]